MTPWKPNEMVTRGDVRGYESVGYRARYSHRTMEAATPDKDPTFWDREEDLFTNGV